MKHQEALNLVWATEANDARVAQDEIAVLGWVDFNAPYARGKEACQSLCKGVSIINESNPELAASIIIQADYAKDSSLRGLYDEERQLFEELFSLNQQCETRFIEVWGRENRKADLRSNMRRFGMGRIVTSAVNSSSNAWLGSELAVYGRSLGSNEGSDGAPVATLPKTAALLIPEPESPDFWL